MPPEADKNSTASPAERVAEQRRQRFIKVLRDLDLKKYSLEDLRDIKHPIIRANACVNRRSVEENGQASLVAVKYISVELVARVFNEQDDVVERVLRSFKREAEIGASVKHLNVLKLLGYVESFPTAKRMPGLIFPWLENGDFISYMDKYQESTPVSVETKIKLLQDVLQGLHYLHSVQDTFHRDIKGANILVTDEDPVRAVICNLGTAKVLGRNILETHFCTLQQTDDWAPPEYFDEETGAADWHAPTAGGEMWSFGVTFLEVLRFPEPPYGGDSPKEKDRKRMERLGPSKPDEIEIDESYWRFMEQCWDPEPSMRPQVTDAIATFDEWIHGY